MHKAVLVVAHGSLSAEWERLLGACLAAAGLPMRLGQVAEYNGLGLVSVALLDAAFSEIGAALGRLAGGGATEIRIVPLFVSDFSSHLAALASFCTNYPGVSLGQALNDHPLVLRILQDRYLACAPADGVTETAVVLIGHGTADPELQAPWGEWASRTAAALRRLLSARSQLQEVLVASLQPDNLRETVMQCISNGWRPILLPLLLADGVITRQVIPQKLTGLPYVLGSPYLPHSLVAEWVRTQISAYLAD
ncbi:MAG: hypothetical protein GX058_01200 [Firmicutes bacterium]|nr:hypothetical protein [Bacillota bacterium]